MCKKYPRNEIFNLSSKYEDLSLHFKEKNTRQTLEKLHLDANLLSCHLTNKDFLGGQQSVWESSPTFNMCCRTNKKVRENICSSCVILLTNISLHSFQDNFKVIERPSNITDQLDFVEFWVFIFFEKLLIIDTLCKSSNSTVLLLHGIIEINLVLTTGRRKMEISHSLFSISCMCFSTNKFSVSLLNDPSLLARIV